MSPKYDVSVDYFAVLGVHYGASAQTVKLAYRKMARRYHPDVSKIHDAHRRFQEVAFAYEVLTKHRENYCKKYDLQQVRSHGFSPKKTYKEPTNNTEKASQEQPKQAKTSSQKTKQTKYRSHKPINGKDRVVVYPLTLRYAIRLLNLGSFYIPGLKVKMKFTRKAFSGKTFRLKGKGYSGLFGGAKGDFLVKFSIKNDSGRYQLKDGDIYCSYTLPKSQLVPGSEIAFEAVSGRVEFVIPSPYLPKTFIKVPGKGLPEDKITAAGDLYVQLVAH